MGTVGTVLHIITLEPLLGRSPADVENLGRLTIRQTRVLDLLARFRCSTGLRVTLIARSKNGGLPGHLSGN